MKIYRWGIILAGIAVCVIFLAGYYGKKAEVKTTKVISRNSGRNIIFILTDDQRFDTIGGINPFFKTPHLDKLAQGGILFENAFVTTSLCSPSRASIMSGQYAHTHHVLNNDMFMPPEAIVFPVELQKAGYRTAYIGKWHMGGESDDPKPGFDHWVAFRGQGVYDNPTFNVNGEQIQREGYTTDLITQYAVDYIKQADSSPFMMYVSHKAVHSDFTPAGRHVGEYQDKSYSFPDSMADTEENYRGKPSWIRDRRKSRHGLDGKYGSEANLEEFIRDYAETLMSVDDSVGLIMDALREKGLLESTLIIFTSDNGYLLGEHGMIDKRSMHEASLRVPLIAHCPNMFPGGQRRKEMIINLDYAPTILEAAGIPVPYSVQGRSFMPILRGRQVQWRSSFLYEYFWERGFPQTPTVFGVRTEKYKYMKYHGIWDRYELYDLQNDPQEKNNLLGDFMIDGESGGTEVAIESNAAPELVDLFRDMEQLLNYELSKTGASEVPSWGLE